MSLITLILLGLACSTHALDPYMNPKHPFFDKEKYFNVTPVPRCDPNLNCSECIKHPTCSFLSAKGNKYCLSRKEPLPTSGHPFWEQMTSKDCTTGTGRFAVRYPPKTIDQYGRDPAQRCVPTTIEEIMIQTNFTPSNANITYQNKEADVNSTIENEKIDLQSLHWLFICAICKS